MPEHDNAVGYLCGALTSRARTPSRRQLLAGMAAVGVTATVAACGIDTAAGTAGTAGAGGDDEGDAVKLYVLDGGKIEVLDWALFQPGLGRGVRRWLSDPCYLIVHPNGTLVWDTGLPDTLADDPAGFTVPDIAVFHVDNPVGGQLVAVGQPAHEIDYLALSHFHPDHVGNVELFSAATLLVQDDEYGAAFGADSTDFGFDPTTYASLRDRPVTPLGGDHDVFGDGSVVIKRLPGHTPGSQSLLVRLPDTGAVLISGDLVHSLENWERRVVPSLNSDPQQTEWSLEQAARVLAEENAVLWVQHDLDQQSGLRRAPDYYT